MKDNTPISPDQVGSMVQAAILRDGMPEQLSEAYRDLMVKETAHYEAEEKRIEAVEKHSDAYQKAAEEARSDGITDEGKIHQKALKATRKHLTALHQAEKASRKAQHEYRLAGMKVDCLNKMVEAGKLANPGGP